MTEQNFMLVVTGDITDEVVDRLYERADDITISVARDGRMAWIEFDREADGFFAAVKSGLADLAQAAPTLKVTHLEPDELVYASDIADRVGRSRQSVDHLIRGVRGPGNFPEPVSHAGERNPIWRWSTVETWFSTYEGREVSRETWERNVTISAMNSAFELYGLIEKMPAPEAEWARMIVRNELSAFWEKETSSL